ncbi:MAG: hypothetical protein HY071_06835 [Chloroflexi bacterium]|nr:hypothetical protein [Chloroflexota bacterium]
MSTRPDPKAPAIVLGIALVFAITAALVALRGSAPGASTGTAAASASPTAKPSAPVVTITQDLCCTQAPRFLRAAWVSSEPIREATVALKPAPGFDCGAVIVDTAKRAGTFGCAGLLAGPVDFVATLSLTTETGTYPFEHRFRTMGDRLENVKWFSEFEDPKGEPLACAAASCRIIQLYTTGLDPLSAQGILDLGKQFNKSKDPGLDPAAIATVLTRLDGHNRYHYYRLESREEATKSAIYWLLRSGKPVMVISLAGQHGPLLVGFTGTFGTFYGDPANAWSGVVVQDPQRGDMRPETADRRPDKYRTPGFQTGQPIANDEWYRDEWWLGFAYQGVIRMPDGSNVSVERNDGVYPTPHWGGKFVIVVDDADAEWPSDREGRVAFR